MAASRPAGLRFQFSLQSLFLITAASCLAFTMLRAGPDAVVLNIKSGVSHYFLLLFGVGPWFARLVGECFPFTRATLRLMISNLLLLLLFVGGLRVSEAWFGSKSTLYMCVATLVLWTPQYMIFFLWNDEELTPEDI